MLMTANIKKTFTNTFTKVHNYRFTNKVKYVTIILQSDMFEDLKMTGLLTLLEQSDLPTPNCFI